MNPIENLWGIMIRKLRDYTFNNKQQLMASILRIWRLEITPEMCMNLVTSMPSRIKVLKQACGGYTKY